ncbi:CDP-diacylglycerol--serine O-phosphatidyltransferase [Methanocaldococcus sp.]
MEIFKILTISDFVTILNLTFGLLSIYFNNPKFIYLAVIFDALDGYVARKTGTVTEFGKELDSLSDIVSFGVATSYFLFNISFLLSLIFCIAGALRLARFNIIKTNDFIGLPIPAASLLVISSLQLFNNKILLTIIILLASYLMISDMKFKKVRDKRVGFIFLIFLLLSCLNYPHLLFLTLIFYIVFSIFRAL